jgi:hypothetical protein
MAEWVGFASALAAAVGLIFNGWQVMLQNQQARRDRRVANEGVVVSWKPLRAPQVPDPDGTVTWTFRIYVRNPGQLPIDNIEIRWYPGTEVRRVQYNGGLDDPTTVLEMDTSVLAGGEGRDWERDVVLSFKNKDALDDMRATVSFTTIDGKRCHNAWPRRSRSEQLKLDAARR